MTVYALTETGRRYHLSDGSNLFAYCGVGIIMTYDRDDPSFLLSEKEVCQRCLRYWRGEEADER